jgi:glycosyltransferase involved in cell wall biosynthesis
MAVKVLICLNTAWNLVNFRSGLIKALVAQGHEVVAVAPHDAYADRLAALGCRFVPLPMDNRGTHPGRDGLLLWRFWRLLKKERPDVYLGYTVKPNVYGSLAAHWLGIPVINNIAGLGAVFIQDGWLVRVVRGLYRLALGRSATVFFQNDDDRQMFVAGGLVRAEVAGLLPGSGIDLTRFTVPDGIASDVRPDSSLRAKRGNPRSPADMDCHGADAPRNDGGKVVIASEARQSTSCNFRFLLIARMLWDKGVGEYVEAAQVLRQRWPQAEFCLLGFVDVQNPAAISRAEMDAWVAQGFVTYLGVSDDVRIQIAEADCVVLPSYREGTPRTLLEAAAMGRPIITTDAVGCREVVQDGHNGLLCQPRDAKDLADKMERMLWLTPAQRAVMGINGRKKMEAEFDEQIVIDRYLAAIKAAL